FVVSLAGNLSDELLHLHPFPTRRSSDLWRARGLHARAARRAARTGRPRWRSCGPGVGRDRLSVEAGTGIDGGAAASAGGRDIRRDRESTRLNSSHPLKSYAVFCLEKKKI